MKELLPTELHEAFDWIKEKAFLKSICDEPNHCALIKELAEKSNYRFSVAKLLQLRQYLFEYEDVLNAEIYLGIELHELVDRPVMVQNLSNADMVKAIAFGMGKDGNGGMCVYCRKEGSPIVRGVHYSRIRLSIGEAG